MNWVTLTAITGVDDFPMPIEVNTEMVQTLKRVTYSDGQFTEVGMVHRFIVVTETPDEIKRLMSLKR